MSEENTASALGQIAFAEYHGRIAGGPLVMPDSWDMQSDAERADWEAAAVAVAAHVTTPTAEDFDAAAGTPAIESLRYALVEQMGHRATIATIRETTFCGKQMLEVTDLRNAAVHLVSPESLYEITWLAEADAFARIRPWKAVALPVAADEADDDDEVAENGGVWGFTKADL